MISGLIAYCTSRSATANAIGNHSGNPRNATAAKPTPTRRATSPLMEGSDRRRTKPMFTTSTFEGEADVHHLNRRVYGDQPGLEGAGGGGGGGGGGDTA